jgi:HAD superfamily hydrolase (TIGR01509 family)
MIEAVIFDVDGVLIDSVSSAHRAKAKLLKEDYGIDIASVPDPFNEDHKGSSLAMLVSAVQQHHGLAIDMDEFQPKVIANVYADLQERGIRADPLLIMFLDELKAHNIPIGIATTAVKQGTENKLKVLGIKDYFQTIVTANDVTEHKPHPEAYLTAIERLQASPAKSFVFEDSAQGIKSGVAAGANVIGVTNYNPEKSPLPQTLLTIDSWSDMNYARLLSLLNSKQE